MTKYEEHYGPEFQSHLLEQYKILVESTHRVSILRNTANAFFLSANTFLLGLLTSGKLDGYVIPILGLCGLLFCLIWGRLVSTYKALNSAKFEVIHEMEAKLPISAFKMEWERFCSSGSIQGHKKSIRKTLTDFELLAPWVFGASFVLIIFALLRNSL